MIPTVTFDAPDPGAMRLVRTLRNALRGGPITITIADMEGLLGVTTFADRTITIADDLDNETWRSTLVHEIVHLIRGPVTPDCAEAEEIAVQHEVAQLLVPNGAALAALDQKWTPLQMEVLARAHVVDVDVVITALNPPTVQLAAVAPRPITQQSVTLAARVDPEQP